MNLSEQLIEKQANETPSFNSGFNNKIINGGFDIWQRGTNQTSSGYGSDDRWLNTNTGTTKVHSQELFVTGQSDVPGNPKYYSRTNVATAGGAGNYCAKVHRFEDVKTLSGKKASLSFYAKADSSKDIAIEFSQTFGIAGSSSIISLGVTTFSLTTSWQKFSVSLELPSIFGKTVGANSYLQLFIWFDAGTDHDARTNSLGQQTGIFDIANVQFEEGPSDTEFEQRPIGVELDLCQRYYEKSYDIDVDPGSSTSVGSIGFCGSGSGTRQASNRFSIRKRTTPTAIFYSTDGAPATIRDITGAINLSHAPSSVGETGIPQGNANTIVDQNQYQFHFTADAEL